MDDLTEIVRDVAGALGVWRERWQTVDRTTPTSGPDFVLRWINTCHPPALTIEFRFDAAPREIEPITALMVLAGRGRQVDVGVAPLTWAHAVLYAAACWSPATKVAAYLVSAQEHLYLHSREGLTVLADQMQAEGDSLGLWLALWLDQIPCRLCNGQRSIRHARMDRSLSARRADPGPAPPPVSMGCLEDPCPRCWATGLEFGAHVRAIADATMGGTDG